MFSVNLADSFSDKMARATTVCDTCTESCASVDAVVVLADGQPLPVKMHHPPPCCYAAISKEHNQPTYPVPPPIGDAAGIELAMMLVRPGVSNCHAKASTNEPYESHVFQSLGAFATAHLSPNVPGVRWCGIMRPSLALELEWVWVKCRGQISPHGKYSTEAWFTTTPKFAGYGNKTETLHRHGFRLCVWLLSSNQRRFFLLVFLASLKPSSDWSDLGYLDDGPLAQIQYRDACVQNYNRLKTSVTSPRRRQKDCHQREDSDTQSDKSSYQMQARPEKTLTCQQDVENMSVGRRGRMQCSRECVL
ncbi:hypothetical protein F2P81_012228 [Scophthalmus maximus]|uniref:Uncharacterized protein n=1 Tax=Scophthalmus maximus TaxID=52904 RepID=A0A6A4SRD8_SCOMX|nr:hypothetical protein F2P81_012228 [Scophthalmus maximus]